MSRFLMDRSIFDNPIWQSPVAFRLFFFLVGKAAFKDGIATGNIILKRGQYVRSYRRLQDDLAYFENNAEKVYSTATLKRCVEKLVEDGRILAEECQLGTLFTVVNYQDYQAFQPYEQEEHETATKQQRNSNETIRTNATNATNADTPPLPPKGASEAFTAFWEKYPKKVTKKQSLDFWAKQKLDRLSDCILEGLEAWKISEQWTKDGGKYIPDAIRFLKEARWEDQPQRALPVVQASKSATAIDSRSLADPNRYQERSGRFS